MIRRRASLIGAVATALPFARVAFSATAPAKVFRVGVLESEQETDEFGWREFVAELSRLGFAEGQNVVFAVRAEATLACTTKKRLRHLERFLNGNLF